MRPMISIASGLWGLTVALVDVAERLGRHVYMAHVGQRRNYKRRVSSEAAALLWGF